MTQRGISLSYQCRKKKNNLNIRRACTLPEERFIFRDNINAGDFASGCSLSFKASVKAPKAQPNSRTF